MARRRPRSNRPFTREESDAYLDRREEWAMLTTIGRDGYPHTTALGYFRIGDDVYLGMRDGTQKVKNVERNPKASVLVTGSRASGEIRGVMLQGDATLIRDDAERLQLARAAARQRGVAEADLPSEMAPGGVYLRLSPRRRISWNFE